MEVHFLQLKSKEIYNFLISEMIMIFYTLFHLLGMSSSVINPILYGFLNKNISEEIIKKISNLLKVTNQADCENQPIMAAPIPGSVCSQNHSTPNIEIEPDLSNTFDQLENDLLSTCHQQAARE